MKLNDYLKNTISQLRLRITQLEEKNYPSMVGGSSRAIILLCSEAEKFLANLGLVSKKHTEKILYWENGPELLLPSLFNEENTPLKRVIVLSHTGNIPSPYQQLLLSELQSEVLLYLESLSCSCDDLLDLTSTGFSRYPISRFAMHVAGRNSWTDSWFWEGYIWPSGVFNIRLLSKLEIMLTKTYENKPVSTSVYLLCHELGDKLRFTKWSQRADSLFSSDSCGLRLSDSSSTTFAYTFSGEFLGYHDTKKLNETISESNYPHFRWKVLENRTIEGLIDNETYISYSNGRWRYTDSRFQLEELIKIEPSLSSHNKLLWDLCELMSSRREGALILITDDPERLINEKVCNLYDLNIGKKSRLIALNGPEPKEVTICQELEPAKQVILEQFRDTKIKSLSLSQLSGFARMDGAIIAHKDGRFLGFGVILRTPEAKKTSDEGARSTAARAVSAYGLAIKVSEDGPITAFHETEIITANRGTN